MTIEQSADLPELHQDTHRGIGIAAAAGVALVVAVIVLAIINNADTGRNPTRATPVTGICDPNMVQVSPMHRGLTVRVTAPGPDVVTVDVWDGFEHRRQTQQITKRNGGATFSSWDFTSDIRNVQVTTKNSGVCEPSLEGLGR